MGNKIVIHGASSFLGKHFIKMLMKTNHMVFAIARENSKLNFTPEKNLTLLRYKKSLNELDSSLFSGACGATYYEFSWQGVFGDQRNMPEQYTVNIPLMINSIQFAKRIKAKHWIGIGSQAEYGNLNRKIKEDDQCQPITLYGKAKLICFQITKDLCAKFNIAHTWIRLFSVYGPESNHNWLIPSVIENMLQDRAIKATLGEQSWDYLYVDDVLEVLLSLAQTQGLGVINLGSGKPVLIRNVINKIKQLTESNSEIRFGSIPYRVDQPMHMEADISKISNQLKWSPKIDLDLGLSRMIANYKQSARRL